MAGKTSSSKAAANVILGAAVIVPAPVNVFLTTKSSAAVTRFVVGSLGGGRSQRV
jgi:hypothetical protein